MSKQPIPYIPEMRAAPKVLLDVPSAWKGIESILPAIIKDFSVGHRIAVEFGVEYGYSLTALSNYFNTVVGIDTFEGLGHNGWPFFQEVSYKMQHVKNAWLLRQRWQDYIVDAPKGCGADLIHVDVDHNYVDTYSSGEWAVTHSPIVLFHDTLSHAECMEACGNLAEKHNLSFYNFEESHGLGILSRRAL